MGLLVWAGRRGGGGLVPAGSKGVAAAPETRRTPSHELQPWAAAEGKRGQTDCIGRKLQDPGMGLSLGCFVRLKLIEGES